MAASKPDEVGQMRRSSGTSMKRMTNDDALFVVVARSAVVGRARWAQGGTYMAMAAKIKSVGWTMPVMTLEMPSARQRIMLRIPSLFGGSCKLCCVLR